MGAAAAAGRWFWFVLGWLFVAVGAVGIVVPGLPTTVFFIVAAACFARCSPRFEQWILNLPRIGSLVRDYRNGLGMPYRAKRIALLMMFVFASIGVAFSTSQPLIAVAIVLAVLVGAWFITFRVPTREQVLAEQNEVPPDSLPD